MLFRLLLHINICHLCSNIIIVLTVSILPIESYTKNPSNSKRQIIFDELFQMLDHEDILLPSSQRRIAKKERNGLSYSQQYVQ